MPDPEILNMPVEFGLELMSIVRSNLANAKRELFDDVINEVDRACLRMFLIDLEGANSGCVVDRSELEAAYIFSTFSFESQKLNVHLDMMPWNLFLIAFGMQLTHSCASGQPVKTVALKDAIDPSVRDFDAVIAR